MSDSEFELEFSEDEVDAQLTIEKTHEQQQLEKLEQEKSIELLFNQRRLDSIRDSTSRYMSYKRLDEMNNLAIASLREELGLKKFILASMMGSFQLGIELKLHELVAVAPNAELRRKRSVVIIRLTSPAVTLQVWEHGSATVMGAKSVSDAYLAARHIVCIVAKHINPSARLTNFEVNNIVMHMVYPETIHLGVMETELSKLKYKPHRPESFPCLQATFTNELLPTVAQARSTLAGLPGITSTGHNISNTTPNQKTLDTTTTDTKQEITTMNDNNNNHYNNSQPKRGFTSAASSQFGQINGASTLTAPRQAANIGNQQNTQYNTHTLENVQSNNNITKTESTITTTTTSENIKIETNIKSELSKTNNNMDITSTDGRKINSIKIMDDVDGAMVTRKIQETYHPEFPYPLHFNYQHSAKLFTSGSVILMGLRSVAVGVLIANIWYDLLRAHNVRSQFTSTHRFGQFVSARVNVNQTTTLLENMNNNAQLLHSYHPTNDQHHTTATKRKAKGSLGDSEDSDDEWTGDGGRGATKRTKNSTTRSNTRRQKSNDLIYNDDNDGDEWVDNGSDWDD